MITIILKGGSEHVIDDIDQWRRDFPGIDVESEMRKASSWCRNNPGRRKTARGIRRFLHNWLSRASESAVRAPKAASHKRFEGDLYHTSDEEKRRGEAQLKRLQAMIERRQ